MLEVMPIVVIIKEINKGTPADGLVNIYSVFFILTAIQTGHQWWFLIESWQNKSSKMFLTTPYEYPMDLIHNDNCDVTK